MVPSVPRDAGTHDWATSAEGPLLLRVSVGPEQPRTDFFLKDPVVLARTFTEWLQAWTGFRPRS